MQAFVENRYPSYQYDYSTLKEVVLDGCKIKALTPEDSQFLSSFQGLVSLSCSCASLTTLIGFPSFPSLRKLELQDNLLTAQSGLDQLPIICPNVRVLRLGGNRIKSAEELIAYLKPLKSLVVLDVDKNPLVDADQCRMLFFSGLPQLKAIDSINVSGHEWNDEEDDEFEEDEEEEGTSEEDGEEADDEDQKALKMFYEKDYSENGDEEDDQDDFNPTGAEEEDDEIDDDDEADNENGEPSDSAAPHQRQPDSQQPNKRQRI